MTVSTTEVSVAGEWQISEGDQGIWVAALEDIDKRAALIYSCGVTISCRMNLSFPAIYTGGFFIVSTPSKKYEAKLVDLVEKDGQIFAAVVFEDWEQVLAEASSMIFIFGTADGADWRGFRFSTSGASSAISQVRQNTGR